MKKYLSILPTVILPIALFIFSPYWGAYFSDKKDLSYQVIAQRELTNLATTESAWPGIKILYEDQDVSTGSFLTLAIVNTGKLPIKREDFDGPIIARLVDPEAILSYKTTHSNPPNLDVNLSRVKEGLGISPMLLNPGDRFVIEIFAKAPLTVSDVTSRIAGIPAMSHITPEPHTGYYLGLSSLARTDSSSKLPLTNIPFWLVYAVSNILLVGTLLQLWSIIVQPSMVARIVLSCIGFVTYILAVTGYALCISYFVEVLDLKRWLGITILIGSIAISGFAAARLRRRYFPDPDIYIKES